MMPNGPSAIPEWSGRRYVLEHHALQACDPSGLFHVPHPPLSSTPSAAPSDEAHLLAWPPYRSLWPPPRILCSVKGSCSAGFRSGECAGRGSQQTLWFETWTLLFQALFGRVQLAIDTTLVSPLHADGSARPGAAQNDGVALRVARRHKERRYAELTGRNNGCRLVVLAGEVGGRWSDEIRTFIRLLARFKARAEPPLLRKRVEQAWKLQWWSLLSCAAAQAFAFSLVELRVPGGADGNLPLACEVEEEQRHAGLV